MVKPDILPVRTVQKVQSSVTVLFLRIYLTYSVSENNPVGGHNGII